jgi:phosphatidylglycerophosphate synthase
MNKRLHSAKDILQWNLLEKAALTLSFGDPTFQSARDVLFAPIARIFIRLGATADGISIAGVTLALVASCVIFEPALAGALLAISLFLDGIDGVVARATGTASVRGEILDIACDTIGIISMIIGLVVWGDLKPITGIVFVATTMAYTYLSAIKSKQLIGKYRSVGSRVILTSYVAVCLLFREFSASMEIHSHAIEYGVRVVTSVLLLNLMLDSIRAPLRHYLTR